jgi:hypothetical protein
MNYKFLGLVMTVLFAPVATNAQVTTLDYQGSVMTGSSDYLPTGFTDTNGTIGPTLPSMPFVGSFDATITLDGSLSANDLTLTSLNVDVNGISLSAGPVAGPSPFGIGGFVAGQGQVDLTTSNGEITGAIINISSNPHRGPVEQLTIGPTGDFFSYFYSSSAGICETLVPINGTPYAGPTINPCDVSASSSAAGRWTVTQAPEIDPASAASGLTLLLGGLAMLRGRRRLES